VINAIKFSIEEIEASDQYFDHTGIFTVPTTIPTKCALTNKSRRMAANRPMQEMPEFIGLLARWRTAANKREQ
jgi:hypothetical protein